MKERIQNLSDIKAKVFFKLGTIFKDEYIRLHFPNLDSEFMGKINSLLSLKWKTLDRVHRRNITIIQLLNLVIKDLESDSIIDNKTPSES